MRILIAILCLSAFGCSSLKKQCEKTNWFNHGQQVALAGKRLNEDNFYNSCQKAEAEINYAQLDKGFKKGMGTYCEPQTAYENGRKGQKFSKDMCDTPNQKLLVKKHAQGVRSYCKPSNGKAAGAKGKPYNHICPESMEKAFLPEFNKGRKIYLNSEVENKKEQIQDLDREVSDLRVRRRDLNRQLSRLGKKAQVSIGHGGIYVSQDETGTPEEIESRRRDLESDIRQLDYQISSKRKAQKELRSQISTLRTEARGL